jgi:hypothetical protein
VEGFHFFHRKGLLIRHTSSKPDLTDLHRWQEIGLHTSPGAVRAIGEHRPIQAVERAFDNVVRVRRWLAEPESIVVVDEIGKFLLDSGERDGSVPGKLDAFLDRPWFHGFAVPQVDSGIQQVVKRPDVEFAE